MRLLAKLLTRFGWVGVIRLGLYPLTLLVTTPFRLAQTLWASRVLGDGQWERYHHFCVRNGVNSLFYWTQAINLVRFGRAGVSPYIGLGNYPLSRWFSNSLLSLYAFWKLAPMVPLVGVFGWLLAHLLWIEQASTGWVLLVVALALVSSGFYSQIFVYQNYNALGWCFFPIGLYGLMTGEWLLATVACLLASFGSFTVVFVAGVLAVIQSFAALSIWPLLTIVPATLKLLTHLAPNIGEGNPFTSMLVIMRGIGMTRQQVRYKRPALRVLAPSNLYFFLLYTQFAVVAYLVTGDIHPLYLAGLGLFLVNLSLARWGDPQSAQMLMMSLALAVTISNRELWMLLSCWLVISPLPLLLGLPARHYILDVVPRFGPVSLQTLIQGMEKFLAPVQAGQRVLVAFANPQGSYNKLFDGYRILMELPLYVATRKAVHLMPDWWAVYESNHEDAPHFWGRTNAEVQENVEKWEADYVVVYQESGTQLADCWLQAGFRPVTEFLWANYMDELRGETLFTGPTPTWWLLQRPI